MSDAHEQQSRLPEDDTRDARGLDYWRSILALCGPSARDAGGPQGGAGAAVARRELFKLFGASLALAGLSGCNQRPRERILPYVSSPPEVTPGVPLEYATSFVIDGFAVGVVARSNDGRPTKIDGNPLHPASLGASSVFEQASVLSLYDPARLRAPEQGGLPSSWEAAFAALAGPPQHRPWFVLPPQSSPVTVAWIERVRQRYPAARFCYDTPLPRRSVYQASASVFGRPLEPQYDFARARRVLALDADFLGNGPMASRWARDFSAQRGPRAPDAPMSRLYVAEPLVTPTGTVADHRLPLRAGEIPFLAAALLGELVALDERARLPGLAALGVLPRADASPHARWIRALGRDLAAHRGATIVIAGDRQPFETQVLALALNSALGNLGQTLTFTPVALHAPLEGDTLEDLSAAIAARSVDALIVLEGNPVYTAPRELDLARRITEVPVSAHLTYQANATTRACQWALPLAHYLESWGDARGYDGTLSFIQPLIEPIYPARTTLEVLASLAGEPRPEGYALLRAHWEREPSVGSPVAWDQRLAEGLVQGSAFGAAQAEPRWERALTLARTAVVPPATRGFELDLVASNVVHDGRFANNAWLLELPEPISKQSWGNALWVAPADADRLGVSTGAVVEVTTEAGSLRAPVLVVQGQAAGVLGLALGYGQRADEALSDAVGVDGYTLLPRDGRTIVSASLAVTGLTEELARTQREFGRHDRQIALNARASVYRHNPELTSGARGEQPSLLPARVEQRFGPVGAPQWGMTIDTTLCTGCSACVIACQAENNVPVVGKAEVQRSREMYWLRIETYQPGPGEIAQPVHQPMLCQHCETAPCEYVCPVNATTHSPDGLNEMVYNRCIGTRFCSNNCPYKVRRFNFFDYAAGDGLVRLQKNPDVTVRERGVMEKCTFCVQRIRGAERRARIERRQIAAGEVVTACQQSCPTGAIQFGALSHAGTPVVEWRREPRAYAALHELGARPRVHYLAKIQNDNPEVEG